MTLTAQKFLKRSNRGAVYIEFAMSALILMGLAIGVVSIGAKEIDVNRDNRTIWSALEIAAELDKEVGSPAPADFSNLGASIVAVSSIGQAESYQFIVTAYQFNVAEEPSIAWQGEYGPSTSNASKVSSDLLAVYHQGEIYLGRPDEHLIFVEMFRQRRGLGFNSGASESFYASGMMLRNIP